ncbi:MAG TPA: CPBP family glutamic-type intramembrane protease [Candidatus Dormibacteraeota bacterium]|nr:CPBP family glutamic-type intramembrane protease [Candidatus Dormibacteraeota bacterium]
MTGAEKRALLLWVALGIIGAIFAHKYFFRAFPEASVNFQVSRDQALKNAQNFVSSLGEDVSSYQSAIIFTVDDTGKTYLERKLGLQEANRLMSSELNIWYWEVRFFKPQQEGEFRVRVNPAGTIAGYQHHIEEARAAPALDRSAAQTLAEQFIASKLGLQQSAWDFLPEEVNSNKRSNRLDWSFTWEKHGFKAADAPYRMQVTLQGDRIGSEVQFLRVPETWERDFAKLRSGNDFYTLVATIPYFFFLGTAIWLGISLTKQGRTSWGLAIKLGVVVAAVLFLMQLNSWPLERMGYDTNHSYSTFVFLQFAKALLFGIGSVLTISLVLPGAEPLYRATQPEHLRLGKTFTLRGLRSKEFFSSAVVGMSMASAHIGFIVAFYIAATHFGAWAPQELNYENSVGTPFPWISGVAIGLLASTNEEFTFRLFAIPFLRRITGSRVLAVLIPAFCWSFLHSNYPQEPAYIRGIEIGLVGIVAGIVMLRWGILATLIWHYTVDASLVGLFLIRSNSFYFKISGVIVAAAALAPFLFSAVSYLSRGKFEEDTDLLNAAEPVTEIRFSSRADAAPAAVESRQYQPLSPAMLGILALCLLAGGFLAWRLKPHTIGDDLKLSVDARSARARGDEVMRQHGLDANSYYHATLFVDTTDPVANEFLRQRIGISRLSQIYAREVPGGLWRVRYFRDSQPEEYAVILRPDGSLHSLRHILPEDAAGASLSQLEAQSRAGSFLQQEKNIDLKNWSLVEANSDKKPHRIDHQLTWQRNMPLDSSTFNPLSQNTWGDHAYARIEVDVLGDEVSNYRTYIKIPDDWRRKQEELTLSRVLTSYALPILLFGGLVITALVVFLKDLRSDAVRSIPWKRLVRWSLWGLAGYVLVFACGNAIPTFLGNYQTSIPLKTTLGGVVIGLLLGAPVYLGGLALVFGFAWYFARKAFGPEHLPGWANMPASYYRDALFIGLGGTGALIGVNHVLAALNRVWPTAHRATAASLGQNFDAILPAAAIIGSTVLRGLFFTGIIAAVSSFIAAQVKQPVLRGLILVLAALAMVGGNWGTPADFAKQLITRLVLLAVLAVGVRWVMRFNILAAFLVAACTGLLGAAAELLSQPNRFYRANGIFLVAFLVLLLGWPLLAWRMKITEKAA